MSFPPQVEQWRPLFRRIAPDLPENFLLGWIAKESGGLECALGIPGVEAGIFQTFHPADDKFGATFAQLRANCGSGQQRARAMTADEAALQVRHGTNFVRSKAAAAKAHFAAAGIRFSPSSKDFWIGVKQEHALPCVMGALLPRISAKLGRPPRSWAEIHATAMAMSPSEMDAGCGRFAATPSVRGLKNRLEDTLVNAEEVGSLGGGLLGGLGGSTLMKLVVIGGLAYGAYTLASTWSSPAPAPASNPARRRRRRLHA